MNPYLHATDLVNVSQCPRSAWIYHQNYGHVPAIYAHVIESFPSLYVRWLKLEDLPMGKTGDSMEESEKLLEHPMGVLQLRLEDQGVRTRIPLLIRSSRIHDIVPVFEQIQKEAARSGYAWLGSGQASSHSYLAIYPHMSVSCREQEMLLMKINQQIAKGCGISIDHHMVLHLNPDYVRPETLDGKKLDPNGLLKLSARFSKRPGVYKTRTIDDMLANMPLDLKEQIALARPLLFEEQPDPIRTRACSAPHKCALYESCFQEQDLPDNSSAFLFSPRQKKYLKTHHLDHLEEILPQAMDGLPMQYAQIMAARHQGQFADRRLIKKWLEQLQWPLVYLDFEWDTFAIPPYAGMKPFDVLCFQYSMHTEEQNGKLHHASFFAGEDCRQAFLDSLLENLPETGSILVYNMEGAEKLRLRQLARQFPAYTQRLEAVCERMVDLSAIFENGAFYDLRQRGRFSLKNVLPLFTDQKTYERLEVQDGLQAIQAYRAHEASNSQEEQAKLARQISTYCAMDTLAEAIIVHGLQDLLEDHSTQK